MHKVKIHSFLTVAFLLGTLHLCAQQKLSDTIQLRETTVSAMRERADLQAARLGEQTGFSTLNWWKSVPPPASRSRFGVFNHGCP